MWAQCPHRLSLVCLEGELDHLDPIGDVRTVIDEGGGRRGGGGGGGEGRETVHASHPSCNLFMELNCRTDGFSAKLWQLQPHPCQMWARCPICLPSVFLADMQDHADAIAKRSGVCVDTDLEPNASFLQSAHGNDCCRNILVVTSFAVSGCDSFLCIHARRQCHTHLAFQQSPWLFGTMLNPLVEGAGCVGQQNMRARCIFPVTNVLDIGNPAATLASP